MAIVTMILNFDALNDSIQVGDTVYYTFNTSTVGGFAYGDLPNTKKLGVITVINNLLNSLTIQYDDTGCTPNCNPPPGSFISFVKDQKANTTSLLGYYADVKFVNNSTDKVELFSVGSEVVESSK